MFKYILYYLGIVFGLRNSLMSVSDRGSVPIDVLVVSGKLQSGLTVVLSVEIESSQGIDNNKIASNR